MLFSECKVTNYFIPTKQKRIIFSKKKFLCKFFKNFLAVSNFKCNFALENIINLLFMNKSNKRKRKSLRERFEVVCVEYLKEFCLKHDLSMYYDWVGNEVGGVVTIGDYFINFDDIRLDIDRNAPEHFFFKWYYESLDYVCEKGTTEGCMNYKTYLSYFMGFSYGSKKDD